MEFSDEDVYEDEEVTLSGRIPSSPENTTYEIEIKAKAWLDGDSDTDRETVTIRVGEGDGDYEYETCLISLTDTSGTQKVEAGQIAEFTILTKNNSDASKRIDYTANIANANIIPSHVNLNEGQSYVSTVQVSTSQSDDTGDYLLTVKGQADTCSDAIVLKYEVTGEDDDRDSRITMRFLNDDTVEPGQTGQFDIKITNTGCDKDDIELDATSETGRTPYFSKDFISLDESESIIVTLYAPTSKTNKDGHYDVRAKAYVDGELVESILADLKIEEDEDDENGKEADIDVRALSGCIVMGQNEQEETRVTIRNRDNTTHKVYLHLYGDVYELNASLQTSTITLKKDSDKKVLVRFRSTDLEAGRYYLTMEAEVDNEIVADDEICVIVEERAEDTTTHEIKITDITGTTILPPTPPVTPPDTKPKQIIKILSTTESITAVPGQPVTISAIVKNNSDHIMDFTMRAQNLPDNWTYKKKVKTLLDGEKREMEITLTPSTDNVTDAFIDLTITAEDHIDIKEVFVKTTDSIIPATALDITTESEEIREAGLLKAIKITAAITNNSTQTAHNISPEMTGLAGDFIVTSSPEQVTLQPSETKNITIMLAPKNVLEHDYDGGIRFRGSNVLTEEEKLRITKEGESDLITGFITAASTGGLLPFLAVAFIVLLASAIYFFRSSHSKRQINKVRKMTSYDGGLKEKVPEEVPADPNNKKIQRWSQRAR